MPDMLQAPRAGNASPQNKNVTTAGLSEPVSDVSAQQRTALRLVAGFFVLLRCDVDTAASGPVNWQPVVVVRTDEKLSIEASNHVPVHLGPGACADPSHWLHGRSRRLCQGFGCV